MRPVGVETATEISAFLYLKGNVNSKLLKRKRTRGLLSDHFSQPCGVRLRNVLERQRNSLDNEVVDAELGALVCKGLIEHLSEFENLVHVDVNRHIVMRKLLLGLREARSNGATHVGNRGIRVLGELG